MAAAPHVMNAAPHAMSAAPHVTAAAPGGMPHAGRPISGQPVNGARTGVVRTGTSRPAGARSTSRNTARSGGTRRHFDNNRDLKPGCSSVPGLGFDAVHLAAVCGPDAFGGGRFGLGSSFFFPFFDGGFIATGPAAVAEDAAASEAQPSDDSEADARDRGRRARVAREEPAPVPVSQTGTTPAGETSEYVFVRRDGTVFFAVAYTWENGTLRYITSEGLRRNVSRDTLDLNATLQFNEQRGLNFRLPA